MTSRKHPQSSIDVALSSIEEGDAHEFLEWCRFKPSYVDMQKRLQELGHQVSVSSLQRWYSNTFPKGDQAIALNALMSPYAGIDPQDALSMSLGVSTNLLCDLLRSVDASFVQSLSVSKPESLLHALSVLVKEQRVASGKLHELKQIRDRTQLELAGGYRLLEIVRNLAKDTPHESVILEFLDGGILQLESEI